jgi:hypothetical protein
MRVVQNTSQTIWNIKIIVAKEMFLVNDKVKVEGHLKTHIYCHLQSYYKWFAVSFISLS